ncbi:MAG TPA: hypothetical protein VJK54_05075, partial [Chthoniobacterales bacterium]|nr:hypothetical protein [Chthoniobacterales bacterium]
SGTPGNYNYSVVKGKEDSPITQLSWFTKARFCNWMENHQPTDFQGPKTTEDGVYALGNNEGQDEIIAEKPGTTYRIKQETEGDLTSNFYSSFTLSVNGCQNDYAPELMMDPKINAEVIKGVESAFKKGLRISDKKGSPEKTSTIAEKPASSTSFTINRASNVVSSAEQPVDPALENQTQKAIKKVINDSIVCLQNHYKKADDAWKEYDDAWQEQRKLYYKSQEKFKQLTLSKQKLDEARKATSDEALAKTRLGKIERYAGMVGGALGTVPEPNTQVASAGASTLGGFVGAINKAWAYGRLVIVEREHQKISQEHKLAQEQEEAIRQQLLPLEQQTATMEKKAREEANQAIKQLAEQIHPQPNWHESQWQSWAKFINSTWSEQERVRFIRLAQTHPNWIEEMTQKAWLQKIDTGQEELLAYQKKVNLSSLKHKYERTCTQHESSQTEEAQKLRNLNIEQQEIEGIKGEIEKQVAEMERLENRDRVQFERKKKEFIESLKKLEKAQLQQQRLQERWEKVVQRTKEQDEERWIASKAYHQAKEEAGRILSRAKKAYQTDRELLQKIWLKSASSNYKDWSLPEINVTQEVENKDSFEETIKNEESEPPIQRLEEIEMQGRDLQAREKNMETLAKHNVLTTVANVFSKQPSLKKQASFLYFSQSSLDQVKEWVQNKQFKGQESAQDQKRWAILEKLDQLQIEIRVKRKELKNELIDGVERNSNEIDGDEEDDVRSKLSTATKQSSSSSSSFLSASKSSVFSFGGKTLNTNRNSKKKSASSLFPINEETQSCQNNQELPEKLKQLQAQASGLKKMYFEFLDQAENERLSLLGQKGAISFSEEADRNHAWEQADRKSIIAIQERREAEKVKKIAQEEQKSWQINTERWRARAKADQAFEIFRKAQQQSLKLGEEATRARNTAELTEANRKKKEAFVEETRLQEAYFVVEGEWDKIAQEYCDEHSVHGVSQEQSNEHLKGRDRAVNRRWEKLLATYQNSGVEKSDVEQEEINGVIMDLKDQLERAYQESLITYSSKEKALDHYKEVAFKKALENACRYPKEMAEIWKEIGMAKEVTPQQEINQQAAAVFKEEAHRLDKIETIWKGILKTEQAALKEAREQAAHAYHRGNRYDWNSLSEQEQMRYNDEAKKANEEYNQKIKESKIVIADAQSEKLKIETEIKRIEKSLVVFNKKEKVNQLQQQLVEIENTMKKSSDELEEQEEALRFGARARQKENYYKALTEAQNCEEKISKANQYWKPAAECYEKASRYWERSADDNSREIEQEENEQIAATYEQAAEAYKKAAQKKAELQNNNQGKETLILLYNEQGRCYEQLADQQASEEINTDSSELEGTLYQLEKKIERYLGTRGAQIEELQENLPLLEKRLEEFLKESEIFHNRVKETLACKKEILVTTLQELLPSCKQALESLLQEIPESSQQAATILTALRTYQDKDQQFQEVSDKIDQLAEQATPLIQRALFLNSAVATSQGNRKLFLVRGEEELFLQFKQALQEAKKIQDQLLEEAFQDTGALAHCETCMDKLNHLKTRDQEFQKTIPQLQQLDQKKNSLQTRITSLKKEETTSQSLGETILIQSQEKLLKQAKRILLEIDPVAEQLLTGSIGAAKQADEILLQNAQFEREDRTLQENATFLRELGQEKNNLQKREGILKRDIAASQSKGEMWLNEGQQKLLQEITQALKAIEQTTHKMLESNSFEEGKVLLVQIKQLEGRDQCFQKNSPILIALEQKRNFFQTRLNQLLEDLAASKVSQSYLSEAQESLTSEINNFLSKINETARKLLISEGSEEAKQLLAQLEELVKRDQQLQENTPTLVKLSEKKNFFQDRIDTITRELKVGKEEQSLVVVQQQFLLELHQALSKIHQNAKQLISGAFNVQEQTQTLFKELTLLEQRDKRLQEYLTQLRDLLQKESALKVCAETLENGIISSQIRGEESLAQAQKSLLEEITNLLEQAAQISKQLIAGDQKTSEAASKQIKELLPCLDQLCLRNESL